MARDNVVLTSSCTVALHIDYKYLPTMVADWVKENIWFKVPDCYSNYCSWVAASRQADIEDSAFDLQIFGWHIRIHCSQMAERSHKKANSDWKIMRVWLLILKNP